MSIKAPVEQRSLEWRAMRCGKVTASRISDLTARIKTGWGAGRKNYMAELIVERLTGVQVEGYVSKEMQWGIDNEPAAREMYEFRNNVEVELIDFVNHPRILAAGASPDSYVGENGLLEIKCPLTWTHIETILGASLDGGYFKQIQWQLACTERKWCDFVSYDPRMPEHLQFFCRRIYRDDVFIIEHEQYVIEFIEELEDVMHELESRMPRPQLADLAFVNPLMGG